MPRGVKGSAALKQPRIPMAAFLDVPVIANPPIAFRRHCDCGNPAWSFHCARCARARTREDFLMKWAAFSPDPGAIFDAILEQLSWGGRNYDPAEERAAFAQALADGAEPEVYRRIMADAGFGDLIEARDAAKSKDSVRAKATHAAKLRERWDSRPIVPLLSLSVADAEGHASDLFMHRPLRNAYWTGTTWSYRDQIELQIFCRAGTSLERAAAALGRSPSSVAWRARDWGLAMAPDWRAAIRRKRKREEKFVPLAYPYVQEARDEHAELLEVNGLVARYLPGREDICQEIMLALWEKKITMETLRKQGANLRAFVRQFFKSNFEMGGYARSLEAPIRAGSDLRLLDTI